MLPCNNIKCRYYKNAKDIDYSERTKYMSQGKCKYNYCKIRSMAKRR